jgi:phospholipid-binding lipoprotein MlaA
MRTSAHAAAARLAGALALGLGLLAGGAGAEPAGAPPEPGPAAEAGPADVPPPSADDLLLEAEYEALEDDDPLERSNRVVFRGNEALYHRAFDPLADVYAFAVPGPVRRSLVRFFDNLGEPADFLNELLQLSPGLAGRTGARFVVNTTVGVLGLLDPATRIGLPQRTTDFGETLGAYGVGEGWYLVVPLLGPSTVRDLFGDVVDGFFHPQSYFLTYTYQVILATSSGFSRYEAEREGLDTLRQSSVDFYAALRSAYRMQRAASVREARAYSPVLRHLESDGATAAVAAPAAAGD